MTRPNSPFAKVLRQRDLLEETIDDGLRDEGRSGLLDTGNHGGEE